MQPHVRNSAVWAAPLILLLPDDAVHHPGRVIIVRLAVGIGIRLAGGDGWVDRGYIYVKRRVALRDASPERLDIVLLTNIEASTGAGILEGRCVAWRSPPPQPPEKLNPAKSR